MNTIFNIFFIAALIFLAVAWVYIGWNIYLTDKIREKETEELKQKLYFNEYNDYEA